MIPLLQRITDVLDKVQFEEAIDVRRELQATIALAPHIEPLLTLKLLALKNAQKNAAEAVKALEHLGLVDEAMEWYAVISKELVEVSQEANKA